MPLSILVRRLKHLYKDSEVKGAKGLGEIVQLKRLELGGREVMTFSDDFKCSFEM
jgi:hypothetical protein